MFKYKIFVEKEIPVKTLENSVALYDVSNINLISFTYVVWK